MVICLVAGWIGVLAKWVNHEDVRVSIPAAKALANLDLDEDPMYLQRLYPLYPVGRIDKNPIVDVVFVHGFLGGVFYTWRQRRKNQNTIGVLGKRGKSGEWIQLIRVPNPTPIHYFQLKKNCVMFFQKFK